LCCGMFLLSVGRLHNDRFSINLDTRTHHTEAATSNSTANVPRFQSCHIDKRNSHAVIWERRRSRPAGLRVPSAPTLLSGMDGDRGRYLLSWLLDKIDVILHVQCMHMPSEMGSADAGAIGRVPDGSVLSMSCPFPVPHAYKWVRKASTSAATATTVCAICRSLVGFGGRIAIHVQDARGRNSKWSSLLTAQPYLEPGTGAGKAWCEDKTNRGFGRYQQSTTAVSLW
jgi:hypothetical protein